MNTAFKINGENMSKNRKLILLAVLNTLDVALG